MLPENWNYIYESNVTLTTSHTDIMLEYTLLESYKIHLVYLVMTTNFGAQLSSQDMETTTCHTDIMLGYIY